MAVTSLVFGIISLVLGVFGCGFQWIGMIIAIIGIILGVKNGDAAKAGMASAGKVCSIIGLVLCSVIFIYCAACAGAIGALT